MVDVRQAVVLVYYIYIYIYYTYTWLADWLVDSHFVCRTAFYLFWEGFPIDVATLIQDFLPLSNKGIREIRHQCWEIRLGLQMASDFIPNVFDGVGVRDLSKPAMFYKSPKHLWTFLSA